MTILRKIFVPLDGTERSALTKLAEQEKRDPRAQAAILIREGLERLGILQPFQTKSPGNQQMEVRQNDEKE
jgi:hypothetical protein